MTLFVKRLKGDRSGAALIEFAFAAPVLILLIFGSIEVGVNLYLRSVLEGAMQQAGRNSSLELAQAGQTTIDSLVTNRVKSIMPGASVTFTRKNYTAFSDIGRPEDFDDLNANNIYDSTECFDDENENNTWDADVGKDGLGGANDVVLYTALLDYDGLLPDMTGMGAPKFRQITASTTLRNQPFSTQSIRTVKQVCP